MVKCRTVNSTRSQISGVEYSTHCTQLAPAMAVDTEWIAIVLTSFATSMATAISI